MAFLTYQIFRVKRTPDLVGLTPRQIMKTGRAEACSSMVLGSPESALANVTEKNRVDPKHLYLPIEVDAPLMVGTISSADFVEGLPVAFRNAVDKGTIRPVHRGAEPLPVKPVTTHPEHVAPNIEIKEV